MKKILWIICCCALTSCSSNPNPPSESGNSTDVDSDTTICCQLVTRLTDSLANVRRGNFKDKRKYAGLEGKLNDSLRYSKKVFVDLLDTLVVAGATYDGLRIYLAAVNDPVNPFHLVFAPTLPGTDPKIHNYSLYYTLDNNKEKQITAASAHTETDRAWNWYIRQFMHSPKDPPGFDESRALWYDNHLLIKTPDSGKCSVLDYLTCSKLTDSVYIYLGAFEKFPDVLPNGDTHDFVYQLTLLFHLHEPDHSFTGNNAINLSFSVAAELKKKNGAEAKTRRHLL